MKGSSHVIVSIAAGVLCTNACSLGTKLVHLSGDVSLFGVVCSWSTLVQFDTSALRTQGVLWDLLSRLVFYAAMAVFAGFPDMDHPATALGRMISPLFSRHRGCTHSCLAVLFLILGSGVIAGLGVFVFSAAAVDPLIVHEGQRVMLVMLVALVLAWATHLCADSMTKQGIPLFWPKPRAYGFPASVRWRLRTGSWVEDVLVLVVVLGLSLGLGVQVLGM